MHSRRFSLACALLLCLLFPAWAQTPSRDNTKILEILKPLAAKALDSTVLVRYRPENVNFGPLSLTPKNRDACLGTIVAAEGWIITKASEIKGTPICKLGDGREFEARLVGIHKPYDLGLLKIEVNGLKPVDWVDSTSALEGHWLITPLIGDKPLALGVVSVPTREKKVWPRVLNPNRGYVGIALDMASDAPKITQVMPNTGASKAGVKVGDLILSIQGKPIKHRDEVFETLSQMKPGDVVTLMVRRKEKKDDKEEEVEVELKATLGRAPADRGDVQDRMGKTLSDVRSGFPTFLTHDTVLRPAECGGPIINIDGKAIGINIASADRTASYVVPSEAILKLLPDLQAGKFPPIAVAPKPTPEEERVQAAREELEKIKAEVEKLRKALAEQEARLRDAEEKLKEAEKALPKK